MGLNNNPSQPAYLIPGLPSAMGNSKVIQTDSSGNLASLTPGTGVITALSNNTNGASGLAVCDSSGFVVTASGNYRTPYTLVNTAIPFILTSGSMGNNGALTLTTAVRAAFPDAYIYMPAGAISAGSAVGWYYAVFSSTSAATVYNNVYTSGIPAIPASPTAFVTTGPGAFTFSTASSYFGQAISLPANSLGINGSLRFNYTSWANNSANAKYLAAYIGTSTTLTGAAGYTSQGAGRWDVNFSNRGATNKQVFNVVEWASGQLYTQTGSSTLDMTAAQTIYSNFYLNVSTSDVLVLESFQVVVNP